MTRCFQVMRPYRYKLSFDSTKDKITIYYCILYEYTEEYIEVLFKIYEIFLVLAYELNLP